MAVTVPTDLTVWPPQLEEATKTPFQRASVSEPDVVELPIPIESPRTLTEGVDEIPRQDRAWVPLPGLLRVTVMPGVPVQIAEEKPYRQAVTIMSIGTAMRAEICYRSDFLSLETNEISAALLPVTYMVYRGQQLWIRQRTPVPQSMSFVVRPVAVEA